MPPRSTLPSVTAMAIPVDESRSLYLKYPLGLDQIRLMHLQSSEKLEDRIVATMSVISLHDPKNLDDTEKYQTISYAWGTPRCDDFIICDGFHLPVTKNLHAGLKRIREKIAVRREDRQPPRVFRPVVWADAACIDQSNNEEKARQVQLMARIYAGAVSVIIWLGEATKQEEADIWACIHTRCTSGPAATTLRNLLLRSWFSRRWIIQEVVFSRTRHVLFGGLQFWFDSLTRLQKSLNCDSILPSLSRILSRKNSASSANTYNRENGRFFLPLLLDNLITFQSASCRNELDRIYALISLSSAPDNRHSRRGNFNMDIDYGTNAVDVYRAIAQMYHEAASSAFERRKSLGRIEYEGDTELGRELNAFRRMIVFATTTAYYRESKFPSWVPIWSVEARYASSGQRHAVRRCSGEDSPVQLFRDDPDNL